MPLTNNEIRRLMADFNPNTIVRPSWATYAPARRNPFKVHGTRAMALNAIKWSTAGILYQWCPVTNGWVEVARRNPIDNINTEPCVNCGGSLAASGLTAYAHGGWRKARRGGPLLEPLEYVHPVCRKCYNIEVFV